MAEKATIEKVLPEKTPGSNGHGPREARRDAAKRRGPRKAKGEPGRWVREAKGILALALAGFGFVALYAYDPTLHPLDQSSPVGPVGGWLGWGSFHAFGYAGYLFPVLLTLYGVSAFVRPRMAHGWQAGAGLAILLVSATGILARASDTLTEFRVHKGGVVGWAVSEALRLSIGTAGTQSRSAESREASARVRGGSPGGRGFHSIRARVPQARSRIAIATTTSTCEPPPTL